MKIVSDKTNLQILHEDNHIIVINKRVGDIVQGDKTGDKPLSEVVKEYIKDKYNKPGEVFLGVVHRLDRPTSGIVIFANGTGSKLITVLLTSSLLPVVSIISFNRQILIVCDFVVSA